MGGRHKFKRGGHSVNAKQHLQNTHMWSRIGYIGPDGAGSRGLVSVSLCLCQGRA